MKPKSANKPPKKKSGELSADDLNLWQQVKRTVEPLEGRDDNFTGFLEQFEKENPGRPNLTQTVERSALGNADSVSQRSYLVAPYTPPVSSPAPGKSTLGGIDDRTARKLLKGRVSIDARIDLHGMTQDQAYRMLAEFLARSRTAGMRMVLVITGKGRFAEGILRQAVPYWLREPQLAVHVSAFRSAHVTHGGEGALYVRLRRNSRQDGGKGAGR